jgi:hypothetical protein
MRDDVLEILEQKNDMEKCLISIILFVNGIHTLFKAFKGIAYDRKFFCDYVVFDLVQYMWASCWGRTYKTFRIHMDNRRPHNSWKSRECLERLRIIRVMHPVYNPNLALSNIFIFRHLKSNFNSLWSGADPNSFWQYKTYSINFSKRQLWLCMSLGWKSRLDD